MHKITLFLMGWLTALPACATEQGDTSRARKIDEVVVIAQPKETAALRLQPVSSAVFTGRELLSLGARDLSELSCQVPSFVMPQYGSRLTSSMYIRGTGSRVNSPAVGVYVDNIPLVGKGSLNFRSYQLDRVEILRGPQGTLYGMNTEGGLVRMHSKSPLSHEGTELTVGAGTNLYRNVELAHYNKVSDALGFSAAGFYSGQNGFFKNSTTGRRADSFNEAGGKGRIVWKPSGRVTLDLVADYQHVSQGGFPYGLLDAESGSVAAPAGNRENEYRRDMLNTGLCVSVKADAFEFSSMTSWQHQRDCMRMDQDYLPQDYMHLEQRQLMNAITQELSFKSRGMGAWRWAAGVYFSRQWTRTSAPVFFDDDFTSRVAAPVQSAMQSAIVSSMAERYVALGMTAEQAEAQAAAVVEKAGGVSLSVGMEVPALFRTPQSNIGLYHESNVRLGGRLTLTLGLRYDYSRVGIDYDTRAAMAFTANVMGAEAVNTLSSKLKSSLRDGYSQLLPKIGLTYALTDDGLSNVYAAISKGCRAGGYNMQMFSDILQAELQENSSQAMTQSYDIPHTEEDYERVAETIAYKPEESWSCEAGARFGLFGGMARADVAAYCMVIRNQQLSVMAAGYGFGRMMVNAGRSRSIGVEASLSGRAIGGRLSWAAGYGLTSSVFRDYKEESGGVEVSYRGKRVPYIPEHTVNARASYRIGFTGLRIRSLTVGADVAARGKTWWDEANTYCQPFHAVLGANASLSLGGVELKVWCRNLTGTRYNTFAFESSASGSALRFAQRGNPRQAGFDVCMSF